jgi:hypothetical protein
MAGNAPMRRFAEGSHRSALMREAPRRMDAGAPPRRTARALIEINDPD